MINQKAKLNPHIFEKDLPAQAGVEQEPIRKGWNANAWSIPEPERDGARRGRGIFQQKNICDLVKAYFNQIQTC